MLQNINSRNISCSAAKHIDRKHQYTQLFNSNGCAELRHEKRNSTRILNHCTRQYISLTIIYDVKNFVESILRRQSRIIVAKLPLE